MHCAMRLISQGVITKALQVVKDYPLHTISAYAVTHELEDVLRIFYKLRISKKHICIPALLYRPCLDTACF